MSIISQNATSFSINNTSISTSAYTYSDWLKANVDDNAILYRVATLNATSLTITIQGRHSNTYTHAASIYTEEITAAQSFHEIINITEKVQELRIGAKIDVTSTPNNFYAGIIRSESR